MFKSDIYNDNEFSFQVNYNLGNADKKGRKAIMLISTINGERIRLYIGKRIDPRFWTHKNADRGIDEKAHETTECGSVMLRECKSINALINKINKWCKEYANKVNVSKDGSRILPYNAQTFKSYIKNKLNDIDPEATGAYIQRIIEKKMKEVNRRTHTKIANGTIDNHRNALRRLKLFCKDKHLKLSWNIFDKDFESRFTEWCCDEKQNYAPNTIASQFSIMKVWLNEVAIEDEDLLPSKAYTKWETKLASNCNNETYLDDNEMKALLDIDFNSEHIKSVIREKYKNVDIKKLEEIRDLFIIARYTSLRYSDWGINLRKGTIQKEVGKRDVLVVFNQKTAKNTAVVINDIVQSIIDKYDGLENLPEPPYIDKAIKLIRICGWLAGIDNDVAVTKIRGGKFITETHKKYELMDTHIGRESFVTNGFKNGINFETIRAATGHTSQTMTDKYNRLNDIEKARLAM